MDSADGQKRRARHHRPKRRQDDNGLDATAANTHSEADNSLRHNRPSATADAVEREGDDVALSHSTGRKSTDEVRRKVAGSTKRKRQEREEEEDFEQEELRKTEPVSIPAATTDSPPIAVRPRTEPCQVVTDYRQLALNPLIVESLEREFKFTELTGIQSRSIPAALDGRDLLAEAKTGSGKTLGFLIPIVENITRAGFKAKNGTAAIIIGPTRELCQQIEGVLLRLLKFFHGSVTYLCCIGGQSRGQEGFKLVSGQMIVIASPGRLLDHLKLTEGWQTKNLLMLAVDEADRVLDNGFEDDLREIVSLLPRKRQTFLFSATQTTRVEQLARISFYKPPLFISLKTKEDKATVDTLEQGYVLCPSEHRLLLLYHFIKKNLKKKVIVFFSSRNSVSFHCELLNYVDVPCIAFHGKQKQHQRSSTYMQFCNAPSGVLLTTDVAARGLDIPKVDWIVQYDPPDDPVKYIHRVGRTARAGRCGNALMFLLPQEQLFLKYLYQDAHISVNEYNFDISKLDESVRSQLEKIVMSNYYLRTSARQAFEGYLLSYSSCQLKNVFSIHQLDLARVAKGFALSEPPPVKIDLSQSAAHLSKKNRKEFQRAQQSKDPRRKQIVQQKRAALNTNISGEWDA